MTYTEKQKLVIDTVIELTKKRYPKDREMMNSVIRLTEQFRLSFTAFAPTCDGMVGFIQWAKDNNQEDGPVLSTLLHDLGEFESNREESWFSPRTHRYAEFIKDKEILDDSRIVEVTYPDGKGNHEATIAELKERFKEETPDWKGVFFGRLITYGSARSNFGEYKLK
jgi:hypothetical protein